MRAGIAGAGLVGRLLAFRLLQAGWQVTLFDKDDKAGRRSAAYAAAGMLSPLSELENSELAVFRLGEYSLKQWPILLSQLSSPVYFQQQGSIIISHSTDRSELSRFMQQMKRKEPNVAIEQLSKTRLSELEPELNFQEGYYIAQEGQVDARELLSALTNELDSLGAIWQLNIIVDKIEPRRIYSNNQVYSFDWVFDCRGGGASDVFSDLRQVRGELIHLYAKEVQLNRPIRLLHPRYRIYVVPRPGNRYVIGASEIEADDVSPISVRTCLELLSAAYSVHTGFAEARVIETVTGVRPALNNNLPCLLFSPGLMAINGLYRHGFLVAPALVDETLKLLENRKLTDSYASLVQKVFL